MGTRETEVRQYGRCEGGLGQERNDGGGCATMGERSVRVESPGARFSKVVMLRNGAVRTKQNLSNAHEFVVW